MLKKVCVIGLGEVGLPTALYIKDKGFEVWGYDISPNALRRAEERGIKVRENLHKIPLTDIYINRCINRFKRLETRYISNL